MMPRQSLPDHFPYQKGLDLTITEHAPPEPFGQVALHNEDGYHRPQARDPLGGPYRTALEWYLEFPLAETEPIEDAEVHTLHIVEQVACGAERIAQVVRCYLDDKKEKPYIAKIYDALYSRPEFGDFTYEADENYACEAAAYHDIWYVGMDGQHTPRYDDAWTFDLPIPGRDKARPVRMILIEDIPGHSMNDIIRDYLTFRIPPEDRLAILAEVFEIYSKLEFIGVMHCDIAPRNVMISGLDFEPSAPYTKPRVVLIDFNFAKLLQRLAWFHEEDKRPQLPVDPKSYLGSYCQGKWKGWVPEPHRSNPAAWRGWVRKLWPNSEDFRQPSRMGLRFNDRGDFVDLPPEPDREYVSLRPPWM